MSENKIFIDTNIIIYAYDITSGNKHKIAGDILSDLTWQASASISYRFDKFDTVLGYRYLDYEFDGDAELIDNLNISGPFAGVKFRF
ncbi:MAG: hypothetical protein JRJ43_02045 [Deltaproteobacteria bacterium]|nr:hypothetical protein [Deltaproteobacteria bacterium]MBW1718333.1 hypothetical protein [Deltaproteobacteria bacterium]MBW1932564.1 hypothetical protein [Deltaproteobacteria bacterium]MBW1937500.1 hypothetical protein [Deltaproteobacteria bacterium]MBW1964826.1 hypothetical protein [Deltaproteobacteria bacterium]